MLKLEEGFVVIQVQIALFEPFLANVGNFSSLGYGSRGELEIKACQLKMFVFEPQGAQMC